MVHRCFFTRYALLFWDHGLSWAGFGVDEDPAPKKYMGMHAQKSWQSMTAMVVINVCRNS